MSRRQAARRHLSRDVSTKPDMPVLRPSARLSRGALLAGTSLLALIIMAAPDAAVARALGGYGSALSAVSSASDAATLAAQQAATVAKQSSIALTRATQAIQAMQSVQNAARAAAQASQRSTTLPQVSVANGLAPGGLVPDMPAGWSGAGTPTQSTDGSGQTQVGIKQTAAQAILNWNSFNVGARTTLTFDQQGNASWVALNRVTSGTAPSQILGNINAAGQVYVINQNGIIFGGNSQINVGSLIASTAGITDAQFLTNGIYSTQSGSTYLPSFTGAGGKIIVENGALITTSAPASVTSGGGFVLLMGTEVDNAGSITTPKGQTELAAGDDFILRQGFGTTTNSTSTTRGNEIAPVIHTGSGSGTVDNTGLIFSQQGDITLAGHAIVQDGILVSTTSVNQRGTIHLLNSATDTTGSVTLSGNALTLILPELDSTDTALDSQRDALIADSATQNAARAGAANAQFNNLSLLADREDQSRVEIVTGGLVDFRNGALTMAQGGQVAVSAGQRVFAETGSTIDVSGVQGVMLPMSANEIQVNIQGNELRDSPQNRDSGVLANKNVWIDIRDLILVPAGTGGYATDRYYTPGGLLEVSGYLSNTAHTIGEWTALGGTITLAAPEVVAQQGSTFNISGGSVSYAGGTILSTNLRGSDGRIYSVDNAPADMTFIGLAGGFMRTHNINGQIDNDLTEIWSNPFGKGATSSRFEAGYTVGRDAGQLILSTPTSIFEGTILAAVITGQRQTDARPAGVTDGYKLTQNTAPLAGTLALGQYSTAGLVNAYATDVVFGDDKGSVADTISSTSALPGNVRNTAYFSSPDINAYGLGGLNVVTADSIRVDASLNFESGAQVRLVAPVVDIKADITAPSGIVTATNIIQFAAQTTRSVLVSSDGLALLTLENSATIDTQGLWVNALLDPVNIGGLAFLNGGNVTFDSSQGVNLASGSTVDVSSGGAVLATGKTKGGTGGNITLKADDVTNGSAALVLAANLRGYGVSGGGALTIAAPSVLIGDNVAPATSNQLVLPSSFFAKGFDNYDVTGVASVTVAANTELDVTEPVYQFTAQSYGQATGTDAAAALTLWTPPLYLQNPQKATLTQRAGASLALRSTAPVGTAAGIFVGDGAVIQVDPLQSVHVETANQITINGAIVAPSGTIALVNDTTSSISPNPINLIPGQSIWLGENSRLDVAARAVVAYDTSSRPYGVVPSGGSIIVGTDQVGPGLASNAFIVIRPGAVLDASGTSATIDLAAGTNPRTPSQLIDLASNGGSIALASNNGLYIDGTLEAHSGGASAIGGTLSVTLATASPPAARIITVSQDYVPSGLSDSATPGQADPSLVAGNARLSADGIEAGGFDNVSLYARDIVLFEGPVSLSAGQSITLSGIIASSDARSNVTLSAPYVLFSGNIVFPSDPALLAYINVDNSLRSTQSSTAVLTINADLIDFQNDVRFGVHGSITKQDNSVQTIDAAGFGAIDFVSQGDIRFGNGTLVASGDLNFTAAQLYPLSEAQASITTNDTINIARINDLAPQLPFSVFGRLTFNATTINQGGIVRAPLGLLSFAATDSVNLLAGSITSASTGGLIVPYGGTTDDVNYLYNGTSLVFPTTSTRFTPGVSFAAQSVNAAPGSTLDLSGGGDLAGSGFISGRGGSVDVLATALANANPANSYSAAGDSVYAIVPGYASNYAPVDPAAGTAPGIGQQITIQSGVPGLPAGTYTLLPARYALLPGGFRVEIGKTTTAQFGTGSVGNGSYVTTGYQSIANTGAQSGLASRLIVTSAGAVRSDSQYDETTYSAFALAQAATLGQLQPALPADAKTLQFQFTPGPAKALNFDGMVLFSPAAAGQAGTATFEANSDIEVFGSAPTEGFNGVSLRAADIDTIGAARTIIGGHIGIQSVEPSLVQFAGTTPSVTVRDGAVLTGPEIFLVATQGGITVESGAQIMTAGHGNVPNDSSDGYLYDSGGHTVVAVSNGFLDFLPPLANGVVGDQSGTISIGACGSGGCSDSTIVSSDGTISFVTAGGVQFGTNVRYGAKYLDFAVPSINIGNSGALAGASVPSGLAFNQDFLNLLLNGNDVAGAPKLQQLTLTAGQSINFFGTVDLNTIDPVTGKSVLQLDFDTPAIYGYGSANDVVTLTTGTLVWNGIVAVVGNSAGFASGAPGTVMQNGPGTGAGTFNLVADDIVFGFASTDRPNNGVTLDRLMLGFSTVNLIASERITANSKGSLSVYQSQGDYVEGSGYSYSGGNLNLVTPLLTGAAASVNTITAGGALTISAPAGVAPAAVGGEALGAELDLNAASITQGGTIALPSGRLTMTATNDITLTPDSRIDLAGRAVNFFDTTKYSWGGDVVLTSTAGNVTQQAGAVIDISAANNNAGTLTVEALGAGAGIVELAGLIKGDSSGEYIAGGGATSDVPDVFMPYAMGGITIGAQTISDFAGLNQGLNASGVTGSRSFDIKQGDLVVGNEVKANSVTISVDGGSLTVTGTIDASGAQVGSIRLSARDDLELTSSSKLDAHGTVLQVDSYGNPIEASNRATVELTTTQGILMLDGQSSIDVSVTSPQGTLLASSGQINLNAPRGSIAGFATPGDETSGDIKIIASAPLNIVGAASIAVNGFWTYTDAPLASAPDATGNTPQVITQAYLDAIDANTQTFMAKALANTDLLGRLAGLAAYQATIVGISSTPNTVATGNQTFNTQTGLGFVPGQAVTITDITNPHGTNPATMTGTVVSYNNSTGALIVSVSGVTGSGSEARWVITAAGGNAFHLRPGVEIDSATANGDLTVQGDLDFSGYRYSDQGFGRQVQYDLNNNPIPGSGEPGVVIIRAGGNLNIYGSITDGFGKPVATPDDNSWILIPPSSNNLGFIPSSAAEPFGFDVLVPIQVTLAAGAQFGTKALNFAIPIEATMLDFNVPIPTAVTLSGSFTIPAGGWVATATIQTPLGGPTFVKGQTIPAGTVLPDGTTLAAGSVMPAAPGLFGFNIQAMTWPAGAPLSVFRFGYTADQVTIQAGSVLPSGTIVNGFIADGGTTNLGLGLPTRQIGGNGTQGEIWAVAPLLAPGSLSWSIRLVAGADLGSADTRGLQSKNALVAAGNSGNLILGDQHYTVQLWDFGGVNCDPGIDACGSPNDYASTYADYSATPAFSVIRTGTGDLDLLAGGNFVQHSLYGIYTAGTQSANVDPIYQPARATFFNFGAGDGTVLGLPYSDPGPAGQDYAASLVDQTANYPDHGGNLLLSVQGNISTQSLTQTTPLNFFNAGTGGEFPATPDIGNWLWRQGGDVVGQPASWWINFGSYIQPQTSFGFFGAPVPVLVGFTGIGTLGGGNVTVTAGGNAGSIGPNAPGLDIAAASTGRVALGSSTQDLTGGGNISVKIAGGLSNGSLTDIRGNVSVEAGSVGSVTLSYSGFVTGDPRTLDLLAPSGAVGSGGPNILLGDGHVTIDTMGDLVIDNTLDPGRVNTAVTNPFTVLAADGTPITTETIGGTSWFTLWTAASSIDLFAAGGNLTPNTQLGRSEAPPTLIAAAANGIISFPVNTDPNHPTILELAPSPVGQLELLAGQSIFANGYNVEMSGADPAGLPTPFHPAFSGSAPDGTGVTNVTLSAELVNSGISVNSLFAFEADTPSTALHAGDSAPILLYAVAGDIENLQTGDSVDSSVSASHWYRAAKPVQMRAGRDIVGSGGLIVQNGADDISTISAGRDIFYANFDVAGQGLLQITAGRNVYQADKGVLHSIGPLLDADKDAKRDTGTGITVIAGTGATGPDYAAFVNLYLNPANLANPDMPLADQPGKVVENYDDQLLAWLQQNRSTDFNAWLKQNPGQSNSPLGAYAFFQTLGIDQQAIFLRIIYFDELAASGREFNAVGGPRQGSYLRGRDAIAALFPDQAANGSPITYNGDVTMFGPSGIHTDAGGAVQVLTPGGQTLIGVEGQVPPSTAGLITQGSSDIDVYSQGSVLLGLSRIMTSFGGNIVVWSAEGDINAGRGSKTTPVFTPPLRTYNNYGSISLSPTAPSSGAGIATLNPIPEITPGNIDLIAPLGTIDAGEAGIRASGNVNLSALVIVNAANIQAQGSVNGIPVLRVPSISTSLSTSNATAATQQTALPVQNGNNDRPSIIIVEVLGYGGGGDDGNDGTPGGEEEKRRRGGFGRQSYDLNAPVQILGHGALTEAQMQSLTAEEKQHKLQIETERGQ